MRQVADDFLASGEARPRTIRRRAGGVKEGALGGWIASTTGAERRLALPKRYSNYDKERDDGWENIYWMEPEVAEAVRHLIDDDGNLRRIAAVPA